MSPALRLLTSILMLITPLRCFIWGKRVKIIMVIILKEILVCSLSTSQRSRVNFIKFLIEMKTLALITLPMLEIQVLLLVMCLTGKIIALRLALTQQLVDFIIHINTTGSCLTSIRMLTRMVGLFSKIISYCLWL